MCDERENGSSEMRPDDACDDSRPSAVVRTVSGELEAEAIRTALESAGIPVRIKMESVARLIAVTVDGLGKVEVLVPPARLDEARGILETVVDQDELAAEALSCGDDERTTETGATDATDDGPKDAPSKTPKDAPSRTSEDV